VILNLVSASAIRHCALLGAMVVLSPLMLRADSTAAGSTPAPDSSKSKAMPVSASAKAQALEETVFFTVHAGGHEVLGRCTANGTCKAYLGRFGQGWQPFPDPRLNGDDLIAASSPDGTQLALLSTRGGSVNLWLISSDGRQSSAVTDDDAGIMDADAVNACSLAFSPDSKNLAYIARGEAWVLRLSDRQTRTLTYNGGVRAVAWNPAGDSLALVQDANIRRIDVAGGTIRTLVANGCDQPNLAWSLSAKSDDVFYLGRGASRVNGSNKAELLMPSSVQPNSLALLPSGVALLAPSNSGQPEVFVAPYSAKESPTQVTQGGAQRVLASPTGKSIYFVREGSLWRCEIDGSHSRQLGAVPVSNINVGQLPPLPGACQ